MKNIIVWNDIPLFYTISKDALDAIRELFCDSSKYCQCTFISYSDSLNWAKQIQRDCITIGTRPGKLFGFDNNITVIRKKSSSGHAEKTYLSDESVSRLESYLNTHRNIVNICEDASVEGNTLCSLIEAIRKISDSPIRIKLLCAAEKTIKTLLSKFELISIDALFTVPGEPITDCTVLFVSDLIHDDPILRMPFIFNKKLMYPCFYEKYMRIKETLCSLVSNERLLPYYQMMIREVLFVTDLDGTLIERGVIPDYQNSKWKSMINEGIPITVATSRSEHGMRRCLCNAVPILPTIHYNGALIYDQHTHTILDVHTFKSCDSASILEHSLSVNASVLCICLLNGKDVAYTYQSATGNTDLFSNLPDRCESISIAVLKKSENIITIYEHTDSLPLVGNHHVYTSNGVNQYTPSETDKGKAASLLADKLGFKKIIAFGNADNDLPLSKHASRFYSCQLGKRVEKSISAEGGGDVLTLIEKECATIYESL